MTKEVMRLKFLQSKLSIQEFDEFFSQNVVMPKGKYVGDDLEGIDNEEIELLLHKLSILRKESFKPAMRIVLAWAKDKIVIPKGENRHPYADVLHEWIEGAEMQRSFNLKSTWVDVTKDSHLLLYGLQDLRIKQPEPVYEWQWYFGQMFGIDTVTEGFHTEEEIGEFPFRKKEETKRIRQ